MIIHNKGKVVSAGKTIMPGKPSNDMWASKALNCSNSFDHYCEKCRKVTVWFLLWGRNSTTPGFFTGNALLDGWARWVFPQYSICSECETRIPL